tara:strand:+ start:323 stop:481 length:159 start_codon:yes stop_codon:yes gene_type:complete
VKADLRDPKAVVERVKMVKPTVKAVVVEEEDVLVENVKVKLKVMVEEILVLQ